MAILPVSPSTCAMAYPTPPPTGGKLFTKGVENTATSPTSKSMTYTNTVGHFILYPFRIKQLRYHHEKYSAYFCFMFDVFFTHVNEKVLLTKEEQELVKTFFSPKKLRKKQYLLQEGDVCKYLAFTEKGLLRSYNVDDKGSEHMIQFAWEGWWIADTYSFLSGEPSEYNIDAIEDAELLLITLRHFEEMMTAVPKMERYFRILFQNNIISKERRLISSITYSAEEKYSRLLETNPQIIQRIPQNLIASYLGITPETLSRIRKSLAHKK